MTFFGMALFTAIGTVVLSVLAIFTTVYAIRAYRAQFSELKDQRDLNAKQSPVLELQARELQEALAERKREADERRRAQASGVFITIHRDGMSTTQAQRAAGAMDPGFATVRVTNTSKQPVYDLVINWHKGTAPWGDPDTAEVLMPDEHLERMRAFPDDLPPNVDRSVFGAVVRFRDAAAITGLRGQTGSSSRRLPTNNRVSAPTQSRSISPAVWKGERQDVPRSSPRSYHCVRRICGKAGCLRCQRT